MHGIATEIVLVAVLPALLIAAAIWDLISFTIPNLLSGAILLLFIAFAGLTALNNQGMDWGAIGLHLAGGLLGLVIGVTLFAKGWVGGGDAKLFAVACLWLGWNTMLPYALFASILGGCLTLAIIALRRIPLPLFLARQPWLLRLADKEAGIPYGIALSAAALFVLPQSELYGLAVTS